MKVGDLVEVITRPIGHMYLRKYIGTKHKIISIVEGKIYLDNIDEEDLMRYEKLYYWERELALLKDDKPQVLKDNKNFKKVEELLYAIVTEGMLTFEPDPAECRGDLYINDAPLEDILINYQDNKVRITIEKI